MKKIHFQTPKLTGDVWTSVCSANSGHLPVDTWNTGVLWVLTMPKLLELSSLITLGLFSGLLFNSEIFMEARKLLLSKHELLLESVFMIACWTACCSFIMILLWLLKKSSYLLEKYENILNFTEFRIKRVIF